MFHRPLGLKAVWGIFEAFLRLGFRVQGLGLGVWGLGFRVASGPLGFLGLFVVFKELLNLGLQGGACADQRPFFHRVPPCGLGFRV